MEIREQEACLELIAMRTASRSVRAPYTVPSMRITPAAVLLAPDLPTTLLKSSALPAAIPAVLVLDHRLLFMLNCTQFCLHLFKINYATLEHSLGVSTCAIGMQQ